MTEDKKLDIWCANFLKMTKCREELARAEAGEFISGIKCGMWEMVQSDNGMTLPKRPYGFVPPVDKAKPIVVAGEASWRDELGDIAVWKDLSVERQDDIISKVCEVLGDDFSHQSTTVFECAGISHRLGVFKHNLTGIVLVLIPGVKQSEKVVIKPMLVGRCVVTQAQWTKIDERNPSQHRCETAPVDSVSWHNCDTWLRNAGQVFRLPTETEWEYACRAGSTTDFCFGPFDMAKLTEYAACYETSSHKFVEAVIPPRVGERRPNAFGLHDMHGGVWEWCATSSADAANIREFESSGEFAVRGGSFVSSAAKAHSGYRRFLVADTTGVWLGFRVVKTV